MSATRRYRRKNFCQDSMRFKTAKATGVFIGMLNRLFRSVFFNVIAFIAGFGACFIIMNSLQNRNYTKDEQRLISKLEKKMQEIDSMDVQILQRRKEMRDELQTLKDDLQKSKSEEKN